MPKCEWQETIDCPPSFYNECPVRLKVNPLMKRQSEIEQHWEVKTRKETSEYADLSGKLGDIATDGCPLREKLLEDFYLEDFSDEELAEVGAKRLPLER